MRLLSLFIVLVSPLLAGPIRPPLETEIKGANGNEVAFTILAVWSDGFHARQPFGKPPLFVAWENVDLDWLTKERPDIEKQKSTALAFPKIVPEEAQQQLDTVRKNFRAPRTITYTYQEGGMFKRATTPNNLAQRYYSSVRAITPETITAALKQIVVQYERDATPTSSASNPADVAQRRWLTGSFRPFLSSLISLQARLDPVHAGDVALPTLAAPSASSPFAPSEKQQSDQWF